MTETTFADPDDVLPCVCANCDWEGPANQIRPIQDLWERIEPGGTLPIGECPECHALAYLAEDASAEAGSSIGHCLCLHFEPPRTDQGLVFGPDRRPRVVTAMH